MINMSYCEMAQFIELCCVLLTGMWKTECTVSQVTSFGNIARKLLARYPSWGSNMYILLLSNMFDNSVADCLAFA